MQTDSREFDPADAKLEIVRVRDGVDDRGPGRRGSYALIWVESGHGEHEIDFIRYPLTAHRIYLTVPGQVHAWHDHAFQGRVFRFEEALSDPQTRRRLLFASGLHGGDDACPFVEVAHRSASDLITLGNLLEGECHCDPPDWSVIRPLLDTFLTVLARASARAHTGAGRCRSSRTVKLLEAIEVNYGMQRSLEFYAGILGLSPGRANQIARQCLGRTIMQLVHDRVALQARRELCMTDHDVAAVGHRLGFDDPSYFSRFFRRQTGASPIRFRQAAHTPLQPTLPFGRAV